VTQVEAYQTVAQLIAWTGFLALSPMLYRLAYAFSYYITGRLKKRHTLIVQLMEDGVVISEAEISLDSKSPIVKQLDACKRGTS
jgi:hypothetical protein